MFNLVLWEMDYLVKAKNKVLFLSLKSKHKPFIKKISNDYAI